MSASAAALAYVARLWHWIGSKFSLLIAPVWQPAAEGELVSSADVLIEQLKVAPCDVERFCNSIGALDKRTEELKIESAAAEASFLLDDAHPGDRRQRAEQLQDIRQRHTELFALAAEKVALADCCFKSVSARFSCGACSAECGVGPAFA